MSVRLPLLTQSEIRTFRRCSRERLYSYVLGFKPAGEIAVFEFGKHIDASIAKLWDPSASKPVPGLADPIAKATADALVGGYQARWMGDQWQSLGQHVEFRAPLINPETGSASRTFDLGGELDGLAARENQTVIVERKTTSEDITLGSDYWRRLRIDTQISTYYTGARALGHEPDGCLYDVIKKPTIKPFKESKEKKYTKTGALYAGQHDADETPEQWGARLLEDIATAPEKYFARGMVVRLPAEEQEAQQDAWQTARAIADADRLDRHPRNADSCVRWGRTCGYFDVCTGAASLDDPARFRRTERRHEELAAQ